MQRMLYCLYVQGFCDVQDSVSAVKENNDDVIDMTMVRFKITDRLFTATNVATNTGFQCGCQG